MTDRAGREGKPAAVQAQENAERAEHDDAADPEHRREGDAAAEQAHETDPG